VDEPEASGKPMRGIDAHITISANRTKLGFPIFWGGPGFTGSPTGPGKGGNPEGLGLPPIGNLGSGPIGGVPGLGRKFCPPGSIVVTLKTLSRASQCIDKNTICKQHI
jgi:hypothetical protein